MFLQLSFNFANNLQQTVLVLNTIVFIITLVIMELVYSEASIEKREHLKIFYPFFIVLSVLLIYAAYKQVSNG